MYKMNFEDPGKVHFIGIGGISMSGLAEILLKRGFTVSGSDRAESVLTNTLKELGADIFIGQRAENIPADCDAVVYTAAVHSDNPEYAEAVKKGLAMLSRAELLGQLMQNYDTAIAVSGTHGKTTTTSMLSHILLQAQTDPTISVGGMLPAIGGNIRIGEGKTFLTEACEYTNSFLSFYPTLGIILNVEADHLDFFGNLENIRSSFRKFAALLPENGNLVINAAIDDYRYFTKDLPCSVITFSDAGEADYTAEDITFDSGVRAGFTVKYRGEFYDRFQLNVPGEHNVGNALAAIAAAHALGIDKETVKAGLLAFTGTERRFQYKGTVKDAVIVDDYAHHPTECEATMKIAEKYPHKRVITVFQPHTYTRTKAFLPEFAQALKTADLVILPDIYAARETDDLGVSSKDLAERINALGAKALYFPTFAEIEEYLKSNIRPGDLVITMGAGNVHVIGEKLLEK